MKDYKIIPTLSQRKAMYKDIAYGVLGGTFGGIVVLSIVFMLFSLSEK